MKRWRDLTVGERHREMIRFAAGSGGRAVTLNFSAAFEKFILTTEDPMRAIGQRMNRELVSRGLQNLPILLILETSRKEKRPHIHGVYIAGAVDPGLVREAMRKAVGKVASHSGSRQFYHRDIFYADGWWTYITMDHRLTRRLLRLDADARLWWVSRSLLQDARDYQTAARADAAANLDHQLPGRVS